MFKKIFSLIILSFAIFSITSIFANQRYEVSDLGTLHMGSDEAIFINDHGEVCIVSGESKPKNITSGNFLKTNVMENIKYCTCLFWSPKTGLKYIHNLKPIFLTNLGHIVGYEVVQHWSPGFGDSYNYKTAIFDSQTSQRLSIIGDYHSCRLVGCNDNGQIVFHSSNGFQLWNNGEVKQINDCEIDYWDYPVNLNNKGELLGTGKADYGYQVARYHPVDLSTTHDINPSMKKNFYGVDINNLGQCIIYWKSATEEGAFLWPLGKSIPTNSRKINDKGQILAGDTTLIEPNGEVIDINKVLDLSHDHSTPFEKIDYIHDINNSGQMVGRGVVNGKKHAVLISPRCY
jgi:hypothetical protein